MTGSTRELALEHMDQVLLGLAGLGATPRDDQLDAIESLLEPRARVLVVQATGWGKSAVYWAATSAGLESSARRWWCHHSSLSCAIKSTRPIGLG